jgi:hypothetical protein
MMVWSHRPRQLIYLVQGDLIQECKSDGTAVKQFYLAVDLTGYRRGVWVDQRLAEAHGEFVLIRFFPPSFFFLF